MKFRDSVLIHRPLKKVFDFVANIENNCRWQTDILELEMTSPGPLRTGSTYRCVNRFMGQRFETEGQITALIPEAKYSVRITSGEVRGRSTLFFEAFDDGTRLTVVGDLELVHLRLAAIVVRHKIKKQLKKDMRRLKKILENGSHAGVD